VENYDERPEAEGVADDLEVYHLIARGNVTRVPYMDIRGFRELHIAFEPQSLTDLAVLNAVYRPGHIARGTPELIVRRKREGDATVHVHPAIDAVLTTLLRESWGVPVFQDQITAIIATLTGGVAARAGWILWSISANGQADKSEILSILTMGLTEQGFTTFAAGPLLSFLYEWVPYSFSRKAATAGARRVLAGARAAYECEASLAQEGERPWLAPVFTFIPHTKPKERIVK
jgi:DNA polymerase-3 subunit alpha